MYYCQVLNNEIARGPEEFASPPSAIKGWLPCNYGDYKPGLDTLGASTIYADRVEYAITAISDATLLANAKTAKELEIRAIGAAKMLQIVSPYTAEERDTWATQVYEAKAYTADNNALTPMIDAIAAGRGIPRGDQATRILANESGFKLYVGQILGVQQAKIDQIGAATTVAEVEAITWT